ncbi:MAG: DUF4292 domain-containing protein [Bacteroidales bacterium]|nr:DUF4292 domain-containing protein [Bacteroidales bacterium]
MSKQIAIALLALSLVAVSCASRKKTVAPETPQSFEWLTSNMSIQAEGNGMSFNDLSGQMRMRKDSLIWLSVTATMGVEVLRAKVSTDSVWVINRLEKTYLAEPLDSLALQLGVPFSLPWVQTLLLDNNQGLPPVENQTVQLKTFLMGGLAAKVKYTNIKLDQPPIFPLKITDKMERIRLKKQP